MEWWCTWEVAWWSFSPVFAAEDWWWFPVFPGGCCSYSGRGVRHFNYSVKNLFFQLCYHQLSAILQFQYGNPDKLCSPMIEAKKAGEDLVVTLFSKHPLISLHRGILKFHEVFIHTISCINMRIHTYAYYLLCTCLHNMGNY